MSYHSTQGYRIVGANYRKKNSMSLLKSKRKVPYAKKTSSVRRDGILGKRVMPPSRPREVKSHWLASLVAPLVYEGGQARIPDTISYPTCTSTIQLELTQSANTAQGQLGGVLCLTSNGPRYFAEDPTSPFSFISTTVANNYTYGGTTALGNTLIPGAYNLCLNYTAYRIVAAGIQVEFIGSDSNNQGQITASYQTSSDVSLNAAFYLGTQAAMENARTNYTGPAKDGANVHWIPLDMEDCVFGDATTPASTMFYPRRWTPASAAYAGTKNYGGLQWHAQGLSSTSAAQFRVTIRIHVEGIPTAEYCALDTGKVHIDVMEVDDTFSSVSLEDTCSSAKTSDEMKRQARKAESMVSGGAYKKAKLK